MHFAVAISFLISFLLCPLIIKICKKFDWYDKVNPRKIHEGKVSRLGGIAVVISFLAVCLPVCAKLSLFSFAQGLPIFAGFLVVFLIGIFDDFFDLRARFKLIFQILSAICVISGQFYFNSIFGVSLPFAPILGRFITFFWVLLVVNAYNLIDGMDWLCGGLSFFGLIAYGTIFAIGGSNESIIVFAFCASILGFMFWNRPKAKIFLGDGGSLSIGYALAIFPLIYHGKIGFDFNRMLLAILISSIPIIDVFAAILRRTREHRSFFSPDRRHIHHKLLNIGFSPFVIRLFLFTLQILLSTVAILTTFVGRKTGTALLLSAFAFNSVFFISIHYINIAVTRRMGGHLEDHPMKE